MATTLEYRTLSISFPQEIKEIPSPDVQLEPLTYSDDTLDLWTKWMNDPDIRQYMSNDLPTSKNVIKTWLEIASTDLNRHYFTILSENKNIGFVYVRTDEIPNNTGEIGILIGEPTYREKGIGSKAIEKVLESAQNDLKLESIRAQIKPFNKKSIALFTKNEFIKDAEVSINGEPFVRYIKTFPKNKLP